MKISNKVYETGQTSLLHRISLKTSSQVYKVRPGDDVRQMTRVVADVLNKVLNEVESELGERCDVVSRIN